MKQPTNRHPLLETSACELAAAFARGDYAAVEILEAFLQRIEEVDEHLNAVVFRRFDEARAEAVALDAARKRGADLGPLAGVPITIKECFHVQGTPATVGVERFQDELSLQDAALVRRLRRAGAVVMGKTNVPQLMVLHETDNPVYGRTNNPWNLDRSPGGSSGGEGAIIAAGGSPLGLGSDLGGSIRVPAHVCGIHGLKPTTGRLTNLGSRGSFLGMETIQGQPGPLARHVDDLHLALGVLASNPPFDDPDVHPVPLADPAVVQVAGLRVGMWTDDGYFQATPGIRRAVMEAADALRDRGAIVEEFVPPGVEDAIKIYYGLVSADGCASMRDTLGSSPADPRVKRLLHLGGFSTRVRNAAAWWLESRGQKHLGGIVGAAGALSAQEYWHLTHERTLFVSRFLKEWHARRFDAMICPPHALPALLHGKSVDLTTAASYCFVINMLGVPAGVVATTRIRPGEESDRPESRDQVELAAAAVEEECAGLPVGVQVMAPLWREDIVLGVMRALEQHFSTREDYPCRLDALPL